MSDNNGIYYYFTLSANFEDMGTSETLVDGRLIPAEGITGKVYIYNCDYIGNQPYVQVIVVDKFTIKILLQHTSFKRTTEAIQMQIALHCHLLLYHIYFIIMVIRLPRNVHPLNFEIVEKVLYVNW